MSAIQEHSATCPLVASQQLTSWKVPGQFSTELYHIGCTKDQKSHITSDGLVAGGDGRTVGRQAAFFTLVNILTGKNHPDPMVNGGQKIPYKHVEQNQHALHAFDAVVLMARRTALRQVNLQNEAEGNLWLLRMKLERTILNIAPRLDVQGQSTRRELPTMHPLKITDDYVPTQEAHELRDAENIDPLEQIELDSKVKREGRQDSAVSAELCKAVLEAVPYRRDRQHECALALQVTRQGATNGTTSFYIQRKNWNGPTAIGGRHSPTGVHKHSPWQWTERRFFCGRMFQDPGRDASTGSTDGEYRTHTKQPVLVGAFSASPRAAQNEHFLRLPLVLIVHPLCTCSLLLFSVPHQHALTKVSTLFDSCGSSAAHDICVTAVDVDPTFGSGSESPRKKERTLRTQIILTS